MTWPIEYFRYMPAPSSMIEMMPGAMKAMTQCAGLKPGENVVIACDTNKLRITEALAAAAYAVGGLPTIAMFPPTGAHGAQVPKPVVGACARSDVFFLPTSCSMTHTDAGIEAIRSGARGSNYAIGGEVLAPRHIDVIYSNASLEIDGQLVLDKGNLLIS